MVNRGLGSQSAPDNLLHDESAITGRLTARAQSTILTATYGGRDWTNREALSAAIRVGFAISL